MIQIYIKLNIRNLRNIHGFTQKELAKKLGVTQSYISKLSRDTKSPTLVMVSKIAIVLKVNPFVLLEVKKL